MHTRVYIYIINYNHIIDIFIFQNSIEILVSLVHSQLTYHKPTINPHFSRHFESYFFQVATKFPLLPPASAG